MKTLLKIMTLFSVMFPLAAHAAPAGFVDARTFFKAEPAYDAGLRALVKQFDDICGDTFCEGEFDNLTSLGIDCAIDSVTSAVGSCKWTFAGSYADIDAASGGVAVTHAVKVCDLPLHGDAAALLAFLGKASASGASFHEGLFSTALPGDVTA